MPPANENEPLTGKRGSGMTGGGPHFGMRWLLLIVTLVAVAAATIGGLVRGGENRYYYVLAAAAIPLFVSSAAGVWVVWRRS